MKFLKKDFAFGIITIISGLIIVGTLLWGFTKYPNIESCKERFVLDEISILGILYLKPITIIIYSAFICWLFGLESIRPYLTKLHITIKTLIFLFLCFLAFLSLYEVIWNFFAWSDAYILTNGNIHIDLLYHLPTQTNPTASCSSNFIYTTKIQFLIMAISFYGIYFFHEIMRTQNDKKNSRK
jgi:FlaA1/EpsC-like NDP-sugar epimerase